MSMVFCFAPKLLAILLVFLTAFIIVGYVKKQLSFAVYRAHLWLALLYVAYLIGILFTNHPDIAAGYAENKMSFIIFPILFSIKPHFKLRTNELIIGLAIGTSIASVLGIINGIKLFLEGNTFIGSFTTSFISPIHHPSYFSMLLLIAAFGSFWSFRNHAKWFNLNWLVPFWAMALIMFTLCLSLAGILFLFLLLAFLFLRWINRRFGKPIFLLVLFISPLLLLITISNLPSIKTDFQNTKLAVIEYSKDPIKFVMSKSGEITGNESRLIMWTVSMQQISKYPGGVGTGNVDDYLTQSLENYGLHDLAQKKYNPHNQYLQTAVEIGILGLVVLLLFLISVIKIAWVSRNKLLLLVIATLVFNSFFESMLQRQSGIGFYSFWICLLVIQSQTSPNFQLNQPND